MQSVRTIAAAITVLVVTQTASAADLTACAIKQFRWVEDCRAMASLPKNDDLITRLRYVPLTDDGSVWLTIGGEYRFKMEGIDEPSFNLRPTPAFTAFDHRLLFHADLRTVAGPRLFLQFSAADERGRKPFERPSDESALDVAQAFVDVPFELGPTSVTLRAGRQELSIGPNRLVAVRDAANLRRAFDMAKVDVKDGPLSLALFVGRPVLNKSGYFDDESDRSEAFGGADLTWTGKIAGASVTADVFGFRRERDRAVYQQGAGRESRNTFGVRIAATMGPWDGALQSSYQWGEFRAADSIRAYGVAGEVGYRFASLPWSPRLGASFGYASGDKTPADNKLGTLDVLYPNLSYFTDAPALFPGNAADIEPSVTLLPLQNLTVQAGGDFLFRLSNRDAVYEPPRIPLVPGIGQPGSSTATLAFVKATWRPADHIEVGASYVHGFAGEVIDRAGGEDFNYGQVQVALRF